MIIILVVLCLTDVKILMHIFFLLFCNSQNDGELGL